MSLHLARCLSIATASTLALASLVFGACSKDESPSAAKLEGSPVAAQPRAADAEVPLLETWQGRGAVFDAEGHALGNYDVRMEKRRREGGLDIHVVVSLPDGREMTFDQSVEGPRERFAIHGTSGEGGGFDLGEGVMMTYVEGGGKSFAQTIIRDSDTRQRMVRTELENGEAVRFYREVYDLR